MTDPGMADATYVGPMTPELVEQILDKVGQNMQHLAWKEGICGWLFGGRGAREGCWELRQKGVPMTPELVAQILNKVGQYVYQLAWEAAYLWVFIVCVWGGGVVMIKAEGGMAPAAALCVRLSRPSRIFWVAPLADCSVSLHCHRSKA
jgi:hypothetical protein